MKNPKTILRTRTLLMDQTGTSNLMEAFLHRTAFCANSYQYVQSQKDHSVLLHKLKGITSATYETVRKLNLVLVTKTDLEDVWRNDSRRLLHVDWEMDHTEVMVSLLQPASPKNSSLRLLAVTLAVLHYNHTKCSDMFESAHTTAYPSTLLGVVFYETEFSTFQPPLRASMWPSLLAVCKTPAKKQSIRRMCIHHEIGVTTMYTAPRATPLPPAWTKRNARRSCLQDEGSRISWPPTGTKKSLQRRSLSVLKLKQVRTCLGTQITGPIAFFLQQEK